MPARERPGGFEKHLIDVTPTPVLTWLKGLDDRVLGGMEVLGRTPVLRAVAAADMAADQALTQVYPGVAHPQALLAAVSA